jgi:ketosteroid isomerase-like protein
MFQFPLRVILLVATIPLLPTVGRTQVPDSENVAKVVRLLEADWAAALIKQDTARLQQILSSQFALIVSENPRQSAPRAAWFALLPQYRTRAFAIRELTVRVLARSPPWHKWSDLAISSFLVDLQATVQGADRSATLFITDVWRLEGGRWRVVARYSSLPEPPSAGTAALRPKP